MCAVARVSDSLREEPGIGVAKGGLESVGQTLDEDSKEILAAIFNREGSG